MNLAVISSKRCWHASPERSKSGFVTDGGFPMQMAALAELFDQTTIVVPCLPEGPDAPDTPLVGHQLEVVPMSYPLGRGITRKLHFPWWLVRNMPVVIREVWKADAIHAPIPGDIGTLAMILSVLLRKPLFVRHCGNWMAPMTPAERFWRWFMEKTAGGKNVMLATGGDVKPPSLRNHEVGWIFSTSLTTQQLEAFGSREQIHQRTRNRLIITCRQEALKGTGLIIQSLPLILKTRPEITLDVVGDGNDLHAFKQTAEQLKLGDRVRFHGNVPHTQVMRLLQQADLFVFPSRSSEGFPKAVLEAMACGLPVVSTPVSVLPQLLSPADANSAPAGKLLSEVTPQAIASTVLECLENPDRYRAMAERAMETARGFSLEGWREMIGMRLTMAWGKLAASATGEAKTAPAFKG